MNPLFSSFGIQGVEVPFLWQWYNYCLKKQPSNRAQNNFGILTGHVDWPNQFLLGHVSFLTGQNIEYLL